MGVDSFILYDNYDEQIQMLTDIQAGQLLKDVFSYRCGRKSTSTDAMVKLLFSVIRQQIERDEEKYNVISEKRKAAGSLGGQAKAANLANASFARKNVAKPSKSKQSLANESVCYNLLGDNDNENDNVNDNENDNVNGNENENESEKTSKPTRHRYGEYQNVLLGDDELAKVQAEFPTDWEKRIERLSEYMASTGKSYKSHLATIRAWARKDNPKEQSGSYDYKQKQEGEPWWARYERMQDYILEHAPEMEWQRRLIPDDKTGLQDKFDYKQRIEWTCSEVIRGQKERGEEIIINGKRIGENS